jgi:outer membrane protein
MKKHCNYHIVAALVALTMLMISGKVFALSEGDWLLRFGAVQVSPNDDSGKLSGAPTVGVAVDGATGIFINATYMIRDNIGLELLGATPFKHDISATGGVTGKVAEVKQLPPTFSVQYHFRPKQSVRPYVGAGINYTTFFDEKPTGPLTSIKLDDSWGYALQGGVDVDISQNWFFNADLRYIDISTTATTNLGTIDVDINPWVFSVGVGTRF